MRVMFRVEGSPETGLGHVMRCMALAQSLVIHGHNVMFLMSELSRCFCLNQSDWPGDILPLAELDKTLEANFLVSQCEALSVDWLVLDGYQFDQAYRHSLASPAFKLAIFDDMNNSGSLCVDLIINGAPNATLKGYQDSAPKAHLAIGQDYQVLRQEFLQAPRTNWLERECLTLMFGGSDPKNLTIKLLQALQKTSLNIPITVITGAAYSELEELYDLIKNTELDVTHLHNCQNMAPILASTKLALSAAGGSQFELLACATPSILFVVADNQKASSQDASKQGWCKVIYTEDDEVDHGNVVDQALDLWQQTDVLFTMHNKALDRPVIDGAKNVMHLMTEHSLLRDKV